MQIKISLLRNNKDVYPTDKTLTYSEFKKLLTTFTPSSKDNAGGIIAGHFNGKKRIKENIHSKSIIFLDVDSYNGSITDLEVLFKSELDRYRYIAYSTASYSPEKPKIRIALFLSSEVDGNNYKIITIKFIESIKSKELQNAIDIRASSNPAQLMYLPIIPTEGYTPWHKENQGALIDPIAYEKTLSIIPPKVTKDPLLITTKNFSTYTEDELKHYLDNYPASECDYHEWLEVGSALHHCFQGDISGFKLWDDWSRQDTRPLQYKGADEVKKKWNSFTLSNENPFTFASVIYKTKIKGKPLDSIPMDRKLWCHTKGEKLIPKFTLENFEILLKFYNIEIRFDCIKKDTVIKFEDKTETNLNNAITRIKSLCELNDLPRTPVPETVKLIAERNTFNSWKEWIEAKPWDKKDRFEDLCNTVIVRPAFEVVKKIYLKKWLLQMLHMTCLNDEFNPKSARMVLTFQGKQRIGKTSWLASLVPKNMNNYVLIGQSLNSSNDMDILSCIRHVFVELGEVTSTFRKTDIENLKNFISRPVDSLNLKYIALPEVYRRTTVFFGTTNETNFLSDTSGNSRFMVLPVIKCNAFHYIDTQQLYAQLLEEAKSIGGYDLTEEESNLQYNLNEEFTNISSLEEKFTELFDIESEDRPLLYTATKVLEELGFNLSQMNNKKTTMNEMASILNKFNFKKSAKPRGWYVPIKRITSTLF